MGVDTIYPNSMLAIDFRLYRWRSRTVCVDVFVSFYNRNAPRHMIEYQSTPKTVIPRQPSIGHYHET